MLPKRTKTTSYTDEWSTDLGNVLPQAKFDTCGYPTDTTEYPYLVAIGYNNSRGKIFYACDGVLLNRLYVLVSPWLPLAPKDNPDNLFPQRTLV